MKLSTLMLAGLMTLTSAAAFAEGGSERSKEFYNNFTFMQEKNHGTIEQTAAAQAKKVNSDAIEKNDTTQQPNS
ncbi:hypothetical protein [Pseudomonas fluorescens]|uniref:hypothetical protein n=1 Tax=Pseudomonas fluorescens TaxID=294 RepID=UPI001BE95344|nr:hypothetical protein [Pseudomonas fluorescens]MBT2372463.1 hypothetical protein [Pseudomonas fluorescens]